MRYGFARAWMNADRVRMWIITHRTITTSNRPFRLLPNN
jgi:hypothetical protein